MNDICFKTSTLGSILDKLFPGKKWVSLEDILTKLEELNDDKESLEEELKDLEKEVEDNYRPLTIREQLGE